MTQPLNDLDHVLVMFSYVVLGLSFLSFLKNVHFTKLLPHYVTRALPSEAHSSHFLDARRRAVRRTFRWGTFGGGLIFALWTILWVPHF